MTKPREFLMPKSCLEIQINDGGIKVYTAIDKAPNTTMTSEGHIHTIELTPEVTRKLELFDDLLALAEAHLNTHKEMYPEMKATEKYMSDILKRARGQ